MDAHALPVAERPRKRRERRPPTEPRAESSPFEQSHCARLFDAWAKDLGAVSYSRFRKAIEPVYSNVIRGQGNGAASVTVEELDEAFRSALVHAPEGPRYQFFTPEMCARLLVPIAKARADLKHDRVEAMRKTYEMIHGKKMSSPLTKAG